MATTSRSVGLVTALRYKGRTGMWMWLLHRVTGLGILAFLIIHVVETALVIWNPALYDMFIASYKTLVFRIAELLIFFAVLFHALNGLRIIVQDFWPASMRRSRQLSVAAVIATAILMIPVTWIMLGPVFGLRDEPGIERHQERMERIEADRPDWYEAIYGEEGR